MNPVTCACGCGRETRLRRGKPNRYIHGHTFRSSGAEYIVDANGCWIWQLSRDRVGYGRVRQGGRMVAAHRAYYERFVGPIADDFEIDHLCNVRCCVNPEHMEPVTHRENVLRRYERARKVAS